MITITKEQFITFSLGRQSAQGLPNDYVATFIDKDKDYTVRTVSAKNSALIKEEGMIRQKSYDLTAFQNTDVVYNQLYKALKKYSFPTAALSFEVTRGVGSTVNLGDLVTIQNDDYNISADFRIVKKSDPPLDQNNIAFEAEQYTTNLFDTSYVNSGGSAWTPPSTTLTPLTKYRIVELPYNKKYGYDTAYLFLVQRELGIETGFYVYISSDGTDYTYLDTLYSFSQYGTLKNDYGITNDLDPDGLVFTPYKEDLTWNSVSRQNLFLVSRFAIVDDEVIAFQDYNPSGTDDIALTNVIRGVNYSNVATHTSGADVWITNSVIINNLKINRSSIFYIKLVPFSGDSVGDLASATPVTVTPNFTAKKPYKPARVEATRSGDTVHIKVYPILKSHDGAGSLSESSYSDVYPFSFDGIIQYNVDGGSWVSIGNTSEFDITNVAGFTLNVEQILYNYESDVLSVSVGTADGTYIGRG